MERGVLPSILLIVWHTLIVAADIAVGIRTHFLCPIIHCLHTASIVIEEIIRLVCYKFRDKPGDANHKNTFGWARSQVLGITMNSVLLAALCFSRMVTALKRLVVHEHLHDPLLVIVTGGIGVTSAVVTLFAAFVNDVWQERNSQLATVSADAYIPDIPGVASSTDIDTNLAPPKPKKRRTLTNMCIAILMAIDGFVIMYVSNDSQIHSYTDASLSIIMVIVIILGSFPKLKEASYVLLQAVPENMKVEDIECKLLRAVPAIDSIHEFHLWQLTGNHVVATLHICLSQQENFEQIAADVKKFLHKKGVHSVTVQPEFITSVDERGDVDLCRHDCGPRCHKQKCCPSKARRRTNGNSEAAK